MANPTQHDDFGEKIGGAKKDLWSGRGLYSDDLAGMNAREADKYVKKDNVWKKPDYQAMIDGGVPVDVAFFIKTVRDSLPASPVYLYGDESPEKRLARQEQYIDTVREVQGVMDDVKTKTDVMAAYRRFCLDNGYMEQISEGMYGPRYGWTEKGKSNPVITNKLVNAFHVSSEYDRKVAEVKTDKFGEASYTLPAGSYYLKELSTVPGYRLLESSIAFRIESDKDTELTVTNKLLPPGEDTGTLLIIKRAAGTGRLLPDSVFGVYKTSNNEKVMELTTNSRGEATAELPAGDYYLKELRAPASFVPEPDMIPFKVKVNATVEIGVVNTQGRGTVELVKVDDTGKPLAGGVFTLYRQDGTAIAELTTKSDGTASYELPVGSYYLVEKTAPASFKLDTQRHSFTVENEKTAQVKVVNYPLTGIVEVYFKHVQDGRELAEMKSLTDKIGTDYIKWMRSNGYENMPIEGYTLLRTDYPASYVLIDGKLVVTLWYDSPGSINIPKTGETPPYLNYMLTALSWGVSALCGITLYRMKKRDHRQATV